MTQNLHGEAARPPETQNRLDRLARLVGEALQPHALVRCGGTVVELTANSYRIEGLGGAVSLGSLVEIECGAKTLLAEVVKIERDSVHAKPFEKSHHPPAGGRAWLSGGLKVQPARSWRGRVIDPLAQPLDNLGPLEQGIETVPLDRDAPSPIERQKVNRPLRTGVRVIDLFTPLCIAQRIGIFAGSGVGKSTLLSMMARTGAFDTIVIALVGERGREVNDFLGALAPAVRAKSIAVVATGDRSAMMRRLAPPVAMSIAEHFRDQGDDVLLIVDSVTRYAHALREVGLAAGEPPVARGYAPSVFADLPRLLERAGPGRHGAGSITGYFSVLVDGDDHNDPIADSIRGTLDGHIVLDRQLADQGRFPAVNPLRSISRLAQHVWSAEQRQLITRLRSMMALYEDTRDLRLFGGYKEGADAALDRAIAIMPKLIESLKQTPEQAPSSDAFGELAKLMQA